MRYRPLGRSGLLVSELCLGTMMFGGRTDGAEAARIIETARDAGVNFVDTADVYAGGASERVVGALVGPHRHDWVLATKAGNAMGDRAGPNQGGLSRHWLIRALDDSLQRLNTDWVDIWYLHRDDRQTPFEEVAHALDAAIRAGKVRYWGFSNFFGWQIGEMVRICDQFGIPRPTVAQPHYNAVNRMAERDYLPACAHYGIGVVPYSPLARGVLTGKYRPDEAPDPDTRAGRNDTRMMESEFRPESLVIAQALADHAGKDGRRVADLAVQWLLNNDIVSSVLAGPRTIDQWRGYLDALGCAFTAADEVLIDDMVPAGHASSPGFTDPRYPFTGRRPRVA